MKTEPESEADAGSSPPARPTRRVKSDVKYDDSSSSAEDEDDDYNWHTAAEQQKNRLGDVTNNSRRSTLTFPCELCPIVFKRHGWLKSHMLKTHNKEPPTSQPPPPPPPPREKPHSQSATTKNHHHHNHHQSPQSDSDHQQTPAKHAKLHPGEPPATQQQQQHNATDEPDPMADIAPVRAFFEALHPHPSTALSQHLEQMFKQTTKVMQWLKRQTARDTVADFEAMYECQSEMLTKQLDLFDAATQMIAAKRDSLQFAYEDFVNKHGDRAAKAEAADAAAAASQRSAQIAAAASARKERANQSLDYVKVKLERDADMTEDYTMSHAVHLDLDMSPDGRMILSGESHRNGNGECAGGESKRDVPLLPVNQGTQTEDGALAVSEIRIKDGDEFEFLDSKTGKLFTNKTPADDEDDDELELVELIEVEDEEGDEDEEDAIIIGV